MFPRSLTLAVLIALALTVSASAQTIEDGLRLSEREPAVGVRMSGMAGAGTYAGTADFSSLFANPAGLGYFNTSLFSGSISALSATEDARYLSPETSSSLSRDFRNTQLGHLAYIYKVPTRQGSLVVGGSLHRAKNFDRTFAFQGANASSSITDFFMPLPGEYEVREDEQGYFPVFHRDLSALAYSAGAIEFLFENVENEGPLFDQAVAPGTRIRQEGEVTEEGGLNELSLGGAWEAAPKVMVGLSANITFGTYRFNSILDEVDVDGANADYVVILENQDLVGLDYLRYDQGFESEIAGVNLRAGVSGSLTPNVIAGVSIESPTYQSINEYYWEDLETFFLEGGSLADSRDGEFDYSVTTPWKLGGGLAYRSAGLLVAVDAEYVDWSQMRFGADVDESYFDELNRNVRDSFDPVLNTRIGAEYWLRSLALRAGLAHQPDPRTSGIEFESGATDRTQTFYSAGFGYRFNPQFSVDFAWTQQRFDDLYRPYNMTDAPVIEEEVMRNRFTIGFSATL